MQDSANDSAPEEDRVEYGIAGPALSPCFCFVVVLLVAKGYGYILREMVKVGVICGDCFVFLCRVEDYISDCKELCFSSVGHGCEFTTATAEEEPTAGKVGDNGLECGEVIDSWWVGEFVCSTAMEPEKTEVLCGDCFFSCLGGIQI